MEGDRGNWETARMSLPSQLERKLQLCTVRNRLKGGWACTPTLTSQADFSIMMEYTPEIGNLHSVYTLWLCLWK